MLKPILVVVVGLLIFIVLIFFADTRLPGTPGFSCGQICGAGLCKCIGIPLGEDSCLGYKYHMCCVDCAAAGPAQFVSLTKPLLTPLCTKGVCYVENSGVCPSGYIYQHHPVNGDSCRLICPEGRIYSFDASARDRPSDSTNKPCYCKYGFVEVKAGQFVCSKTPTTTPLVCKKEGQTLANANPEMQNLLDKCCEGLIAVTCPPEGEDALKKTQPVCTNCGDGKCGLGETRCNCPSDCRILPSASPTAYATSIPESLKACISACDKILASSSSSSISFLDLENGWYYASLNQKKNGTPSGWIHTSEGTRSAKWYYPNITQGGELPNCDCT